MKKALLKDNLKEIKNTYKRFISILLMAFLGVGFFAGIRASSPDMVDTIDNYYKEQNVYDIQVISTLGLTNDDIDAISKIEEVEKVIGEYETDGEVEIDNKEIVTKVIGVDEINKPKLLEGRLPENINECVVEPSFLSFNNKKIGDTIEVNIEKTKNSEGEEIEYLKQKELTIVGTVESPLYISRDRGNSSLGAGKVNYYLYIDKENINADETYTNIYIKVKDADKYQTSSTKYEDLIEETKTRIEDIKEEREKARQDQLIQSATEKLQESETEFNNEKQNAENQIAEAEAKIADGKAEIEKAEAEVNKNEETANKELKNAENEINNAKAEISKNEEELNQKETEANKEFENLENQKNELQANLSSVESGLNTLNENYQKVLEQLKNPNLPEEQKNILEQQKHQLESEKTTLEQNKSSLNEGIAKIEQGITEGKQELENAKQQLKAAKTELNNEEATYKKTKSNTLAKIESAKEQITKSKEELAQGEEELEKQKQEAEEKLSDAESKLIDARDEISKIEMPTWYILDRNANTGYVSFIQDTKSVENIGVVFPAVFFIVATLISLTSMTRMVEEQRTQIGTLKALGYSKLQIASKYIIYASLASVIGGILGMCVGFVLLPKIIWMMYEMMYQIGDISLSFNWTYGTIGLGLIFICIVGATIYSLFRELKETPATLMRPKAPKLGKRVLLERITFIWKRLSFSRKVTIRNIFRYKKRFLMTIIGIFGCTSLILAGFGLKDSISSIMPSQYGKVFDYDMQISLKSGLKENQLQEIINKLEQKEQITKIVKTYMATSTAVNGELEEDVQIIVPEENESLKGIINLKDVKTKETITLNDNEICLTDKAAELLKAQVGDTIILKDSNENKIEAKISNIVENYISHYVYMSKELYQTLYGKDYEVNVLLTKNTDLSEEQEEKLATDIMQENEVSSITLTSTAITMMDDTMKSLNYVVVVLIVSAGLLAFVVLYNLANVNISERIRELATIKVLGFYDREVYDYVTRETVLLTLIGIAIGLIGGYFLNYFIIGTCEINMLRFSKIINPLSYVYSILITIGFTLIVNIATYFALKKIDMIESLKSVE